MKTMRELMELADTPTLECEDSCSSNDPKELCDCGRIEFEQKIAEAKVALSSRLRKALPLILGLEGLVARAEFVKSALQRRKLKGENAIVECIQTDILRILSILDGKEGE